MNFERPVFAPSTAAGFGSINADMQRDLRHKGYLTNYGMMGEDQRWKYSFRDIVALAVAGRLIETGWHRHTSCALAWTYAPVVFGFLRGASIGIRYVAHLIDAGQEKDGMKLSGTVSLEYRSLAEMDSGPSFDRAEIIDLKYIANCLHPDLKDLAKEITVD